MAINSTTFLPNLSPKILKLVICKTFCVTVKILISLLIIKVLQYAFFV